jgi:hypothetical protein
MMGGKVAKKLGDDFVRVSKTMPDGCEPTL